MTPGLIFHIKKEKEFVLGDSSLGRTEGMVDDYLNLAAFASSSSLFSTLLVERRTFSTQYSTEPAYKSIENNRKTPNHKKPREKKWTPYPAGPFSTAFPPPPPILPTTTPPTTTPPNAPKSPPHPRQTPCPNSPPSPSPRTPPRSDARFTSADTPATLYP